MRVYLALGSNLGARADYLRAGISALAQRHIAVTRIASVYSTEPRDVVNQPWFLNTTLEADTNLEPNELLSACLDIESTNERVRSKAKGPRTLDIDIVFYGNEIIRQPHLTIPHPGF